MLLPGETWTRPLPEKRKRRPHQAARGWVAVLSRDVVAGLAHPIAPSCFAPILTRPEWLRQAADGYSDVWRSGGKPRAGTRRCNPSERLHLYSGGRTRTDDPRIMIACRARPGSARLKLTQYSLCMLPYKRCRVAQAIPSRSEWPSHCLSHGAARCVLGGITAHSLASLLAEHSPAATPGSFKALVRRQRPRRLPARRRPLPPPSGSGTSTAG